MHRVEWKGEASREPSFSSLVCPHSMAGFPFTPTQLGSDGPDRPDMLVMFHNRTGRTCRISWTRRGGEWRGGTLPGIAAGQGGVAVDKGHGRRRKDATSLGHNRGKWASLSLAFASFWGEY